MAGAAAAGLTGSAFVAASSSSSANQTETVTGCSDNTVMGLLQGISRKVTNIETVLGAVEKQTSAPIKRKPGIDIVLGAQWGDEGKGKLVDILSQVRNVRSIHSFIHYLQSNGMFVVLHFQPTLHSTMIVTGVRCLRTCRWRIKCWTYHCCGWYQVQVSFAPQWCIEQGGYLCDWKWCCSSSTVFP